MRIVRVRESPEALTQGESEDSPTNRHMNEVLEDQKAVVSWKVSEQGQC